MPFLSHSVEVDDDEGKARELLITSLKLTKSAMSDSVFLFRTYNQFVSAKTTTFIVVTFCNNSEPLPFWKTLASLANVIPLTIRRHFLNLRIIFLVCGEEDLCFCASCVFQRCPPRDTSSATPVGSEPSAYNGIHRRNPDAAPHYSGTYITKGCCCPVGNATQEDQNGDRNIVE